MKEAFTAVEKAKADVNESRAIASESVNSQIVVIFRPLTTALVTQTELRKLKQLLDDLNQPVQRSVSKIDYIMASIDDRKRRKILEWISQTPFRDHHEEIEGNRLEGTGLWLISRDEFKQWRDNSFSSVFWLTGIGKFGCCSARPLTIGANTKQWVLENLYLPP